MRLITSNRLGDVPVTNVIGVIRGAVEPDRYVIVGSHRDAWGYGAVDSGTNTAALVKMAEAFAHAVRKEGWRPRRTLVFASWAAEEFGLIGSQVRRS